MRHLFDLRSDLKVPIYILALYNDTSLRYPEFYTDFNRLLSIILSYQHFTLDLSEIGEKVLGKYFPSGKIGDHSHLKTVEVFYIQVYLYKHATIRFFMLVSYRIGFLNKMYRCFR